MMKIEQNITENVAEGGHISRKWEGVWREGKFPILPTLNRFKGIQQGK